MIVNTEKYNIPYKSKGRDFDGVDCWGLIFLFYREELNIYLPSWSAEYENAKHVDYFEPSIRTDLFAKWREVSVAVPGDVGLIKLGHDFHVGLCIDPYGTKIMHMMNKSGIMIDRINSFELKDRFKGWYTYVG